MAATSNFQGMSAKIDMYDGYFFFILAEYIYITYKQVIIQEKGLVTSSRNLDLAFPENNLQAMKAFYNFEIITKNTSDISRKKKTIVLQH